MPTIDLVDSGAELGVCVAEADELVPEMGESVDRLTGVVSADVGVGEVAVSASNNPPDAVEADIVRGLETVCCTT